MSSRFTTSEKWEDVWFRGLKVNEKMLFLYLCDKCDWAGFWEVDLDLAAYFTGIPKKSVLGAFQGLSRAYIESGRFVWIRNFIKHQKNWPLNPDNNAHKHIISLLESHPEFEIDFYEEMVKPENRGSLGANQPPCISKGKSNSKGNSSVEGGNLKKKHLDFVMLTEYEYEKLSERFGKTGADERIAVLNEGIGSKGYKYKSHYYTILAWERRDERDSTTAQKQSPEGQAGKAGSGNQRDFAQHSDYGTTIEM